MENRVLLSAQVQFTDEICAGFGPATPDFGPAPLLLPQFDTLGGTRILTGASVNYTLDMSTTFSGTFTNLTNASGSATVTLSGQTSLNVPGASAGNPAGATDNPQTISVLATDTEPFGPNQTVEVAGSDTESVDQTLVMTAAEAAAAGYVGAGDVALIYQSTASASQSFNGGGSGNFDVDFDTLAEVNACVIYSFIEPEPTARISITPDATNEVGDEHTFTVLVEEDDDLPANQFGGDASDGFAPAAGESVTVTLTNANGAVADPAGPVVGNTDANGEFTVTFTSDTAGTVTGHASSNVLVGNVPPGGVTIPVQTDGVGENSDDAVKTFVDAFIEITPDDTNEVGDPHTFTATVFEDTGDGIDSDGDGSTFDPAAGEDVTITLSNANGAVADPAGPCEDVSDANGQITCTFTSDTAGTVTGHASSDIQVGGLSLSRETDGVGNNSGNAVKTFVDAFIVIAPDDTNEVGDPHTFIATVFEDTGDGVDSDGDGSTFDPAAGEDVTITLSNANGTVADPAGPCEGVSDAAGQFSCTFTSDSAGTVTGHASSDVLVGGLTLARETDGTGIFGDAVKTFVDAFITITPDDTNEVGDPHTFTATVFEDTGDGVDSDGDGSTFDPAVGEDVTITLTNANGAVADPAGPCEDVSDANGQITCTFTSDTAGTVTGHASSDIQVGGLSLSRETDGVGNNSGNAVKTFVDAFIVIAPDDTNEVGDPHTFIATVFEDTGDGVDSDGDGSTFDPAAGEDVTITLSNANGAVADPAGPCEGVSDAAGQFSCTFTSDSAGTVTGHASSDVLVGGLTLARETDGVGNNSDDAVKTFVDAFITIEFDATNEVGDPHTFTATVFEDTGDGIDSDGDGSTFDPAAGEDVTITLSNANGAVADPAGPCEGVSDANGQITCTFTSDTAGTVTGHASSDIQVGGLSLSRETDGTGNNSGDAVKTFVDVFITIGEDATNQVGEPHTFTAAVFVDGGDGVDSDGDGSTFDPAGAGVDVCITLDGSDGAVPDISAPSDEPAGDPSTLCGVTDAAGQFSVTFTSQTAGTVTGHATTDVDFGGGLIVERETDGIAPNSDDAIKIFIATGTLRWLKTDNTGAALGGATFQVCRTIDASGTDIPDECISVLDNSPPDTDPDAGEFQLEDIALGTYTIKETIAPAGFTLDPDTETVVLTSANPSNADATFGDVVPVFVNTPPFQGLTPGFWKNHVEDWVGFSPNQTLESVFDVPDVLGLDNFTLLQALNFKGGNTIAGAAQILLRAAVAALLNSAHPGINYTLTTAQVISQVNTALASLNRNTILTLAGQLDAFNNLHGVEI